MGHIARVPSRARSPKIAHRLRRTGFDRLLFCKARQSTIPPHQLHNVSTDLIVSLFPDDSQHSVEVKEKELEYSGDSIHVSLSSCVGGCAACSCLAAQPSAGLY